MISVSGQPADLGPDDLAEVERLAGIGFSEKHVALRFGGDQRWFARQLRQSRGVAEAFGRGKVDNLIALHSALMRAALGDPENGIAPDVKALLFACQALAGMSTKQEVTHSVPALEDPERAKAVLRELEEKLGPIRMLAEQDEEAA